MFHTAPCQLPMALSRVYHCCCEQELTDPETAVSPVKPPLA